MVYDVTVFVFAAGMSEVVDIAARMSELAAIAAGSFGMMLHGFAACMFDVCVCDVEGSLVPSCAEEAAIDESTAELSFV